jgi:hypothetical protein
MRLDSAADALRAAGLRVVERSGWRNRDNGRSLQSIRGLTVHHTAGSPSSSVSGELRVIEHGRPGLSGPISQFMVARDGTWYCTAAGSANHNKVGWDGPNKGYGNADLIGVECQHSGAGEEWTDRQYRSVVRGVAALARQYDFPASRVGGHKEHQPGQKVDPSFSMNNFRAAVARELTELEEEADMPSAKEIAKATVDEWRRRSVGAPAGQDDASQGWALFQVWHRTGHIGNVALPAVLKALNAQAQALAAIRAALDGGQAGGAARLAAMQAEVDDSTAAVRTAIEELKREQPEPAPEPELAEA